MCEGYIYERGCVRACVRVCVSEVHVTGICERGWCGFEKLRICVNGIYVSGACVKEVCVSR